MYSELSYKITKELDKTEKKNNGIYFTPPNTITKNLKYINFGSITNVLEPSCGSCEYILALKQIHPELKIVGIEYNTKIYNSIKHIAKNNIELVNNNFLTYEHKTMKKYDLIIGNPPYYVMKKEQVDKSFYRFFDGRPNIFIIFILKSIKLLKKNGILSFVLPKNFLNCIYYDKTRKYIINKTEIIKIIECNDDYIDTKQDTIILILKKRKNINNQHYILEKNGITILGTIKNIKKLNILYNNSHTLLEKGFVVNVGNVVWNQCKNILTDNKDKTLLIYSSDIKDNKLIPQNYKNKYKKNYIDKKGSNDPLLVINRGYGVGNYNFTYCLIDGKKEYLIENHLICIKYTGIINNIDLIEKFKKIIKSFENKNTKKFIKLYFSNNAINTIELNKILPIYTDI
jgi:tRNA1(Val) A37 N6-methylase TrmN6